MAIPIINFWKKYFLDSDEGLGSSYERIIIHNRIIKIIKRYQIKSVLETPSFGFTGLSGINSMGFAKEGIKITINDHDPQRVELIKEIWNRANLPLNISTLETYNHLPYDDDSFDMTWNFSALWFVDNLDKFLSELNRVTKKIIVLAVPNRSGLGYLSQKYFGKEDLNNYLTEDYIIPKNFKNILNSYGWKQVYWDYFDCPPWPDIGMPKEDFLRKFGLSCLIKKSNVKTDSQPLSVLDYWNNIDPNFANKMMKYYWLEKYSPKMFKAFWAHHKFFVFRKDNR